MMKRLLAILWVAVLLALVFPAWAIEYKTVDIRRTGNSPVRESFYGGDSIGFGYYLTEDNETYDLSEWDMVTWELASYTNSAECWMSVTGRIDNAEGGEISVETMLPLSVVPVGQYKGYVKAVKLTAGGDAVASQRTVVEQTVQVRYGNTELSPDAIDPSELIAQGAFVRQAALDAEAAARIGADESLSNAVAGVRADVDGMGETVAAISNKVAGLDGDLPDFSTFATKQWTETNYIQRELVEQVREQHSGGRVDTNEVLTVFYDSPGQSLYVKHLRVDELTDYNGNAIGGTGSGGTGTVAGDFLPAIKGTDEVYRVTAGAGVGFAGDVDLEGAVAIGGTAYHAGDVEMQSNAVRGAVGYLLDEDGYIAYGTDVYEEYNGMIQYYTQSRAYPYGLALNTAGDLLRLSVKGTGAFLDMRYSQSEGSSMALAAENVTATGTVEVGVLSIGGESYDKLRGRLHGGYFLTPARWVWKTSDSLSVVTNYSDTVQRGSWMISTGIVSRTRDVVLSANIFRNEEWEPIEFDETDGPAALEPDGAEQWRVAWDDPCATGAVFSVTAHIGTWKESVAVTNWGSSLVTNRIATAPAEGCLWERFVEISLDWNARTNKSVWRLKNFGRDPTLFEVNTNFWAPELDLTGVSVWNSDPSYYYTKPLTLVASNLAVGARHWFPAVGKEYGWLGKDGIIHYSTVVDVKTKNPDLGVARLDPPLDTSVVATYPIIAEDVDSKRLWPIGEQVYVPELYGLHTVPIVQCAQSCRTFLMESEGLTDWHNEIGSGPGTWIVRGRTCTGYGFDPYLPHSRANAVGGDSGHPCFAWDGERLALICCMKFTTGAPHLGFYFNDIKALVTAAGGDPNALQVEEFDDWPDYQTWDLDHMF